MKGQLLRYLAALFVCLTGLVHHAAAQTAAPITIYVAKKIITMDPAQPEATAVAIKDQRIYAVGSVEEMKSWMKPGSYIVNAVFANDVITPGMIEPHAHWSMLVLFLAHPYVGYYDFPGYDAQILPGKKSKADVIAALIDAERKLTNPNSVLFAWGYDPIYLGQSDLTAADLDQVSKTRPIFVLNASGHIGYINSVLLGKTGFNANTNIPGVVKGTNGNPNGVLKEEAALDPAVQVFFAELVSAEAVKSGIKGAGNLAQKMGLTTVTDMYFGGPGEQLMVNELTTASTDPNYPVRVVAFYGAPMLVMMEKQKAGEGFAHYNQLARLTTNKFRLGGVKFVSDGSIQGFTARINWPGYFNGAPDGIFNITTNDLKEQALLFWRAGLPIHVHVNGDEATDSALEALAYLQKNAANPGGIFVLEHNQLATPEQIKRARDLGAYAVYFPNHLYFWGDQHYAITLGPDRANKMDNVLEAKRQGVIYSIHTDSPITRLGPLYSMWSAMNRITATGRVLGPSLRLSAEDALRAVTINAATILNLQNEIGSIAVGKRADLTILGRDPLTEPANKVKDIPVIATFSDGVVHLAK